MTVSELIQYLETQPQDLQVAYPSCSEHCLLTQKDVEIKNLCSPRPDGWVHDQRPDMTTQAYLIIG